MDEPCEVCGAPLDASHARGGCPSLPASGGQTALGRAEPGRRLLSSGPEVLVLLGLEVAAAPFVPVGVLVSLGIAGWLAVRDLGGGIRHPGRHLAGVRVVDAATGAVPTPQQAVVRNLPAILCWLLAVVPGVELLGWAGLLLLGMVDLTLILADPLGRRLGDRLASTKVVPGRPGG